MRYDPSEYLYASTRVRALETRLISQQQLNRLLSLSTDKDVLNELLTKSADTKRGDSTEALLGERMQAALQVVRESVPDPALTHFLQYLYDCHNLKVLEKCRHRGLDPAGLLIDLGTVSAKTLQTVSENELFALLPDHMREAVAESRTAFAKTADPQEIDFILDRAAFADMAAAAAPFPLAREWVRAKIDLSNLLFCLRLLRMQNGDLGRSILTRAALPCGTVSTGTLAECYDKGEDALVTLAQQTGYHGIFHQGVSLSEAEKLVDDRLMTLVRKARSVTFGAEVPVAYLLAAETDCKNLRILLSGKKAGLDFDTIQSRMRACYV